MYNKIWIKNFEIAKSYYQKNINLSVPKNFKTKDEINKKFIKYLEKH